MSTIEPTTTTDESSTTALSRESDKELTDLSGVGPATEEKLNDNGVNSVVDLKTRFIEGDIDTLTAIRGITVNRLVSALRDVEIPPSMVGLDTQWQIEVVEWMRAYGKSDKRIKTVDDFNWDHNYFHVGENYYGIIPPQGQSPITVDYDPVTPDDAFYYDYNSHEVVDSPSERGVILVFAQENGAFQTIDPNHKEIPEFYGYDPMDEDAFEHVLIRPDGDCTVRFENPEGESEIVVAPSLLGGVDDDEIETVVKERHGILPSPEERGGEKFDLPADFDLPDDYTVKEYTRNRSREPTTGRVEDENGEYALDATKRLLTARFSQIQDEIPNAVDAWERDDDYRTDDYSVSFTKYGSVPDFDDTGEQVLTVYARGPHLHSWSVSLDIEYDEGGSSSLTIETGLDTPEEALDAAIEYMQENPDIIDVVIDDDSNESDDESEAEWSEGDEVQCDYWAIDHGEVVEVDNGVWVEYGGPASPMWIPEDGDGYDSLESAGRTKVEETVEDEGAWQKTDVADLTGLTSQLAWRVAQETDSPDEFVSLYESGHDWTQYDNIGPKYADRIEQAVTEIAESSSDTENDESADDIDSVEEPVENDITTERLVAVGCSSSKRESTFYDMRVPAAMLYTGTYWEKKRKYGNRLGDSWKIISAEHALLDPTQKTAYYDTTLSDLSDAETDEWAEAVQSGLVEWLGEYDDSVDRLEVQILLGQTYEEPLRERNVFSAAAEQVSCEATFRFIFREFDFSGNGQQMSYMKQVVEGVEEDGLDPDEVDHGYESAEGADDAVEPAEWAFEPEQPMLTTSLVEDALTAARDEFLFEPVGDEMNIPSSTSFNQILEQELSKWWKCVDDSYTEENE